MERAESDRAYFLRRAEEERDRARTASDRAVVLAHLGLAKAYDRLASKAESSAAI